MVDNQDLQKQEMEQRVQGILKQNELLDIQIRFEGSEQVQKEKYNMMKRTNQGLASPIIGIGQSLRDYFGR